MVRDLGGRTDRVTTRDRAKSLFFFAAWRTRFRVQVPLGSPSFTDALGSLIDRGFVHIPRLVPLELVAQARAAIDDDLRRNYDPARESEYSSGTYCPTILEAPAIADLLLRSAARELVDTALGFDASLTSTARGGD
jgi:hypothetical protein